MGMITAWLRLDCDV